MPPSTASKLSTFELERGGQALRHRPLLVETLDSVKYDQLQRAQHYSNFSPCFDEKGQRIGEKVTIWTLSTLPTKGLWRIMWTERNTRSSKLYWVEGEAVECALALEGEARAKWKLCNATK